MGTTARIPEEHWVIRSDVSVVEHEAFAVILPFEGSRSVPFAIHGTGLAIWRLLKTSPTQVTIANEMAISYDSEPALIAPDVQAFLQYLEEIHVIQRRKADAA